MNDNDRKFDFLSHARFYHKVVVKQVTQKGRGGDGSPAADCRQRERRHLAKSGRDRTVGARHPRAGFRRRSSGCRLEGVDVHVGQFRGAFGSIVRVMDRIVPGGWRTRGVPKATMLEDLLDHLALRRLAERHHLHRPAALRAGQRINLVDPLDEHGPGLAGAASTALTPCPSPNGRGENTAVTPCSSPGRRGETSRIASHVAAFQISPPSRLPQVTFPRRPCGRRTTRYTTG